MICLVISVMVIVIGIIFRVFPPKKINGLYGYRTVTSMKNQEIWDYAQKLGALNLMYAGILIGVFGLLFILLDISNELLELLIFIFILILMIIVDEIVLKREFKNQIK